MTAGENRIAVLVPCYNEEKSIGRVISAFQEALPEATVHVCDNDSSDGTLAAALAHGARVSREPLRGKGNVVRRMFANIEADIYIMVDGDDTYDAGDAPALVERLVKDNLDLVNARRVSQSGAAYRAGHRLGNQLLTSAAALFFGRRLRDMLSGYKVMSRRFVKSFPSLSHGFEIETEIVVHALELRMPMAEVDSAYRARPEGTASKLRTVRDGISIAKSILTLVKDERPLTFFSGVAVVLALTALALGGPVVREYLQTGLVPRLPTAVAATGVMLLASLAFVSGLILNTVTLGRREMKHLHYLGTPALEHAHRSEPKKATPPRREHSAAASV